MIEVDAALLYEKLLVLEKATEVFEQGQALALRDVELYNVFNLITRRIIVLAGADLFETEERIIDVELEETPPTVTKAA